MEESERMIAAKQEKEEDTEIMQQEEQEQDEQIAEVQEIWSWGAGTEGQLGTGKLEDEHTPQLLTNLFNSLSSFGSVSFLSCGGAHVIALTSGGKVLTWGRGASGQLGHGQIVPNCLNPKLVESLSSFRISHVSAGWNHSGFVSDCGRLFTCGDGSFGQLGHGNYQSYGSPTEVSFFCSMHVQQVACGMRHSLILTKGNFGDQLYGFGSGKRGQLGVSEDKIRSLSAPQPCRGLEGIPLETILANGDHSAALSVDGHLYTWGRGFSGSSDVCVPQSLPSSQTYKQAAMGWNHALVLSGEDEVFMLGGSHHGLLSEIQNTANGQASLGKPHLSKVLALDRKQVVQVAAGAEHSAIATENGDIYTWGWGEHGQLGLEDTSDQTVPQPVDLSNVNTRTSLVSKVYCGSGFTFVLKRQPALSN